MKICRTIAGLLLAVAAVPALAQNADFTWSWHEQEVIGRNDASLGNTSKLTEAERTALIDAIVLRLRKPMAEAGYDDDRIREIASTTRVRFVSLGSGKPLLFTTSLGMEGGCDAVGNCPLWIFRHGSNGFVSLLTTVAASYTLQAEEVVLMHHVSQKQSGLEVYRFSDRKLSAEGCYVANWPAPSDDPTQVSDPEIAPCTAEERAPASPEVKPEAEGAPDAKLPDAPSPQGGVSKPVEGSPAETQPAPEAKPDRPSGDSADAPAQPTAPEAPAGEAQPAAPDHPAEAQPAADAPPPADTKPAEPESPPQGTADAPATDSKPPAADAPPQADATPAAPETRPKASTDVAPPPDPKPAAPDASN